MHTFAMIRPIGCANGVSDDDGDGSGQGAWLLVQNEARPRARSAAPHLEDGSVQRERAIALYVPLDLDDTADESRRPIVGGG